MAAVVGSVPGSIAGSATHKRVRFGSVEPAIMAVLKQLDPLLAVLTLVVCNLCFRERLFTPAMCGVAVLTFVISSRIFTRPNREDELSGKPLTSTFSRIERELWLTPRDGAGFMRLLTHYSAVSGTPAVSHN